MNPRHWTPRLVRWQAMLHYSGGDRFIPHSESARPWSESARSDPAVFGADCARALELSDEPVGKLCRGNPKEELVEVAVDTDAVEIGRQLVLSHAPLVEQRECQHDLERVPRGAKRVRLEGSRARECAVERGRDVDERISMPGDDD